MDITKLSSERRHVVAICGAAVSGSEAAALCAERGMLAVVFEQNTRPYGKIEDGLPRWHDKLRKQEYARIDENLRREGVLYVPRTLVGRDLPLTALTQHEGVSAVLLATGAWRDRPLDLSGIDAYVDRGFVYQNPFVYWFNHYEEPGYTGPHYEVADGAVVVGGGLASVDVVKIINLELYRRALRERGFEVDVVTLEHQGIPKVLASFGLSARELGLRGATLYYRRRIKDMPVAFARDDSPEQIAKTEAVREKLVQVLAQKFLVRVEELHAPLAPLARGERLAGLRFRRSEPRDGKLVPIAGSEYDVHAELTVSSIGSVPMPMAGVPMRGELYDYADWTTGALSGLSGIYGLGNVLTGKGNIKESRESARVISTQVVESYLGIGPAPTADLLAPAHDHAREAAERVVEAAAQTPKLAPQAIAEFLSRVHARWAEVGYGGDYGAFLAAHPPS